MNVYSSKSSVFVKMASFGAVLLMILIVFTLIISYKDYGLEVGIILSILIIATVFYFYANSLKEIIIVRDSVILKKNVGAISISKSDIVKVNKLGYSNLTMTYGSKGVFGFIGNTMDDSVSFVKDRKNMLQIITKSKKYVLSSTRSDELVKAINTLLNKV